MGSAAFNFIYKFRSNCSCHFFMITGFLFFSKLINSKKRPVDWMQLYISRIFRLMPLYLFAMVLLFLIVAILSNWKLREPVVDIVIGAIRWIIFTLKGAPDLNHVSNTSIILAGVTWTLRYEIIFYLLLPLLALLLNSRPPIAYIVMAVIVVLAFNWFKLSLLVMTTFGGGIFASILVGYEKFRTIAVTKLSTVLIIISLMVVLLVLPDPISLMPLLLLSLSFALIAGGNTLFGLLTSHISRVLGEMAYSIYLLHGILLFIVFHFLLGFSVAEKLSPIKFWLVIASCTPALIAISFFTFQKIELPAMRITPKLMLWIRARRTLVLNSSCKS